MIDKLSYNIPENIIFFDSQDTLYKSPFGAVPCGDTINLKIFISEDVKAEKVILHLLEDNKENPNFPKKNMIEMKKNENFFTISFKAPDYPKLLFYTFEIFGEKKYFYGNNERALGGPGKIYFENPSYYQITTFYRDNKVSNWFKHSIAYQIFPDRFYNGNKYKNIINPKKNSFIYGNWDDIPMYIKNEKGEICRWDFFGGNLNGIKEKIRYLKGLNINLLYLNPIFEAASNHRYDTGDFFNIDPVLGTKDDFKNLVQRCKDRKINIILDGVFNHTGKDSIYFNRYKHYPNEGAYNSIESLYYQWYDFKSYPDVYRSWWGIDDLPCVNELNPHYFDFIIENKNSVISHWMSYGIKGWRLDVADELPSYFIESLKYRCKEIDPESVLIGEVWEEATTKLSYGQRREYFNGRQLDSVMNYPLRSILIDFFNFSIDSKTLCMHMKNFKEKYPKENYYSLFNSLGSHDLPRIKTVVKNFVETFPIEHKYFNLATERVLKSLSLIQFSLPGIPVIYYGDEVGLEGDKDPDNRRTYPWGKEDQDLLKWYRKISLLRNNSLALKEGEVEFFSPHPDVFAFIRFVPRTNEFVGVITNRSPKNHHIFSINLKDFINQFSNNKATDIYQWNNPLIIPLDSSTNFPIKIPPLKTLLFSSKKV